jgi:hypothetical protein
MARGRPFKCPYKGCGSTKSSSKGTRVTKSLGIRKIRVCKDCGRKFTPQNQKPLKAKDKKAGGSEPRQVSDAKPVETATAPDSKISESTTETPLPPETNKDIMPSNEP